MPLIGDPGHKDIVRSLRERVPKILRLGTPEAPRAIIVVTAHWSERNPTISNANKHPLYYDYYGFPQETYSIKYNAPGSPDIAQDVFAALKGEGLSPGMDEERGWDHGVFVPMLLINPKADVPIVQLSVLSSENPAAHFKMGQALAKLRDTNVAIVGSGFAGLHNLRLMFSGIIYDPSFRQRNSKWQEAVTEMMSEGDEENRLKKLEKWREIPSAYEMHPRGGAEHFLPLIVCAGAGENEKAYSYTDEFMGLDMYSYYWTDSNPL